MLAARSSMNRHSSARQAAGEQVRQEVVGAERGVGGQLLGGAAVTEERHDIAEVENQGADGHAVMIWTTANRVRPGCGRGLFPLTLSAPPPSPMITVQP